MLLLNLLSIIFAMMKYTSKRPLSNVRLQFSWLLILFLFFIPQAYAQWWNPLAPKDYEQCILKNMKGVTSDMAANLIVASCHEQFKPATCTERDMSKSEKQKLTIKYSLTSPTSTYLNLNVHNGNENVSISRIIIEITSKGYKSPQRYEVSSSYPIEPKIGRASCRKECRSRYGM